jgi:hypothetical protein
VNAKTIRLSVTGLAWLVIAADAHAQRFIYDGTRDATAQQTVAAAKEVTSGALFAAMLKNVDAQARFEVDTVTAFVQERMRARLNAFDVWRDPAAVPTAAVACRKSVECQLRDLQQRHKAALGAAPTQAEVESRLAAIKKRIAELQAELKALQQARPSADPFIIRAFDALEDPGGDILAYAQKIAGLADNALPATAKGVVNALTALEEGLEQVIGLYKAVAGIWRGQQAVSVDPASLRPAPQQIELQLLAVEQDHLKSVARIRARRELEVGVALSGVEHALALVAAVLEQPSAVTGARPVEATLREAAAGHQRQALRTQWEALHAAAGAVAQLDAADSLAALRLTDEARRYSIRRSAVNISTYDLTLQAAAQRLALYWKSGIKPGELAQFAFYVTNTIALPAIAIKE